jgi:arginyl-tRNA synthetase
MSDTHPLKDQIALLIGAALETVAPDAPVSLEIERPKNPPTATFPATPRCSWRGR